MNFYKKLVFGGRIYTMDPRRPVCNAMIVNGRYIEWLGSAADLSAVRSDTYDLVDLDGATVLPGFIDSHTHVVFWAQSLVRIDLDGATSYEDALTRIKAHLKTNPPKRGSWVIGKGWKREQWRELRWPHKTDLDRLLPNNPTAIYSKDEHQMWVNSAALRLAGIDISSADPAGGEVQRDLHGEPTGILKDNADKAIWKVFQPPALKDTLPIMRAGIQEMLRLGCVGTSSFDSLDGYNVLQALDVAGELPIRVAYYFPVAALNEVVKLRLRSGYGSDNLKVGGIKIFADGALGSQTALMLKPFKGSRTNIGIEVTSPKDLRDQIRTAAVNGLACAIHAIGDRANRNVLDAFEAVSRKASPRHPHRIEHCQIVAPSDLARFKSLGLVASIQPTHATADIDIMKRYLGPRQKDSYRMRSLWKLGVPQAYGSDAPIEELHPLKGIYAAVTGQPIGGRERFNRRETITIEQALWGFTAGGAQAVGQLHERGTLTEGKLADFIVLDRDLLRAKPRQFLDTKVLATYIGGELMYSANGFRA